MYIFIIYKILIYFNLLQNILIYLKSDLILFEKTKITNKMIPVPHVGFTQYFSNNICALKI